jgi:hypothetical protein
MVEEKEGSRGCAFILCAHLRQGDVSVGTPLLADFCDRDNQPVRSHLADISLKHPPAIPYWAFSGRGAYFPHP